MSQTENVFPSPTYSTWGMVQHAQEILPNGAAFFVSTASHGGVVLQCADLAKRCEKFVDVNWNKSAVNFEEDSDWAIFYALFQAECDAHGGIAKGMAGGLNEVKTHAKRTLEGNAKRLQNGDWCDVNLELAAKYVELAAMIKGCAL